MGLPRKIRSFILALTLLPIVACSAGGPEVVTTDNVSDGDIGQQSGQLSLGEKWDCLDQPFEPLITEEETVALFRVVPLMGKVTVNDIEVFACHINDPLCTEPVAGPFYTREDGTVAVSTPTDPFIFFTFTHEEIVPAIVGGFMPVFPSDYVIEVGVFTPGQMLGVQGLTGFESRYNQDTGNLLVVGHDCERNASPGLQITMSPESGEPFYLRGTLPRKSEEETDGSGTAGFLGIEPGYKTLSYEIAESATSVASMTVPILGGWVSEVYVTPHSQEFDTSDIDDSVFVPDPEEVTE